MLLGCFGVPLGTCLGDLWGLLWIHDYFFGHLVGFWGSFWVALGWLWGPFGCFLGALGDHFGSLWLFFRGVVLENVKL